MRSDITETEHTGAVGDHRDEIAFVGVRENFFGMRRNIAAWRRNSR
jgi:hypothetical protein